MVQWLLPADSFQIIFIRAELIQETDIYDPEKTSRPDLARNWQSDLQGVKYKAIEFIMLPSENEKEKIRYRLGVWGRKILDGTWESRENKREEEDGSCQTIHRVT